MKRNEGTVDRIVRTALGIGAIVWAGTLGWTTTGALVLLALAVVLLATAAIGFCPLYHLLGLSTAPRATQAGADRADRAELLARR